MKLSDRVLGMNFSPIEKYYVYANRAKHAGKKVYHLNIGQPDIKTPVEFMQAVKAFDEDVLAYSASEGRTDLIDSVRRYYRRFNVDIHRNEVVITNGGSEALILACEAILDPGDEVIVAEPYYTNYSVFTGIPGAKLVPIKTRAENGYHYADKKKIESIITHKTKAFIICNPGNPTGTVLTKDEMRMICDLAKKHNFFIIADEVYREFAYEEDRARSFGEFEDVEDRVVITDSVSKRFSACGARIGTLITRNEELYGNVIKLAQARLCCPTLDQIGAKTLYDLPEDFFDEIKAEYKHRRDTAYRALKKIKGVVCEKPKGAFYITCKLPIENADDFLIWMLTEFDDKNETVMFAPVDNFYITSADGKDEIRIAYILNERDLIRGIELIETGLKKYKSRSKK